MKCPVCNEEYKSLGHHIGFLAIKKQEEAHVKFRQRQEELVLEFYNQKISMNRLLARNDFYFRYDFVREVLSKRFSQEEVYSYLKSASHDNYVKANRLNTLKQWKIFREEPERFAKWVRGQKTGHTGLHHSLETLRKIACESRKGCVRGFRKDTNRYARSNWEANVDRIAQLENCQLLGEFEIEPIAVVDEIGKTLYYHPDRFDIDGLFEKGVYLEVKGWRDLKSTTIRKLDLALEQCDKKILIIGDGDWADIQYSDLEAKYRSRIPLWEDLKQNLRTRPDLYRLEVEDRVRAEVQRKEAMLC